MTQPALLSLDEALLLLPPNATIVTAMAAAEPQGFFSRLHNHLPRLGRVNVFCANPNRDHPCFEAPGDATFNAFFLTSAIRARVRSGEVQYVPQHLSQWSRNLRTRGPIDVFWGTSAPPDEEGNYNLGLGACYETECAEMARMVILEVNPAMPRTRGATSLPARRVNATVEHVAELPHLSPSMPDDVDRQVAEHVAGLVPDGATIQLGIGAVPDAVGHFLRKKKHLGVHTELVSDAIVDLVESGAVDGSRKSVWQGLVVGAFVLGGQRLYDFVNANAGVELHPASFVNDPWVVGQNTLMHSINTCVEMDLTGQVCSESIGHSEISGVGGAADTHVGAQRSRGGRGILAFRSLSARGDSKIVFELRPGAKVSIGRNDVDTIVTEWGVAELRGRSVAERVMALVRVAHPEFREGLWEKARAAGYLPRGTEGRFVPRT